MFKSVVTMMVFPKVMEVEVEVKMVVSQMDLEEYQEGVYRGEIPEEEDELYVAEDELDVAEEDDEGGEFMAIYTEMLINYYLLKLYIKY